MPTFDPNRPHNDLAPLPPAADIETKAVLKACIAARAAIAELRLAGDLIPDQAVLINAIPILEARDSSEIENIVTTNDALFREASLHDGEGNPATKEALRYRTALYHGFTAIKERPLTARTAIEICRIITGIELDVRATPGTTLRNSFTRETIYTPPDGQTRLRDLLSNWETFLNEDNDLDPIVRMAVLHYQFEAIHPFPDGNGRTGRVLNILSLYKAGLLDLPTLYLSRAILRTKADYYRLLLDVTASQKWEPWIVYMLQAVTETSRWTNDKVRAIRLLMDAASGHVRTHAPKIHSRELIDAIFQQPYIRIGNIVDLGIAKRETASGYLKILAGLGMLSEEKHGRDKVFIHRKYIDLLSADEHSFDPYIVDKVEGVEAKPKPKSMSENSPKAKASTGKPKR